MNMHNLVQIYKTNPNFISQLGGYGMLSLQDVNSTDDSGDTLLHSAAQKGDILIIETVINLMKNQNSYVKNSILNAQNDDGDTPVHIAARNNFQRIVEMLDKAGADLSIANNNGEYVVNEPDNDKNVSSETELPDSISKIINGERNDSLPNTISSLIDSERYVPPKVNKYDSPSFNSPAFLDMLSSDSVNNIFQKQAGGFMNNNNNTTEVDGPSSLSEISSPSLDMIQEGGDDNDGEQDGGDGEESELFIAQKHGGGSGDYVRGARKIFVHQLSETPAMSEGGKVKQSSLLHDETVQAIQDLGYSQDDAKAIKSKLWSLIKEKYPELSNLDKSKKMREVAEDKKLLASIDPEEVRNMIQKNKVDKDSTDKKPAKKATTKKATTKKASKKASRSNKKKKY